MKAGTLKVVSTEDVDNGVRVQVKAKKAPFVPSVVMERRARFRALRSTGFAESGNEEEDLLETLTLTKVLGVKEMGEESVYTILVDTPF